MIRIGSAKINESGKITGGLVGDQKQTSKPDYKGEVSMEPFYVHSKGWFVLRPKDPAKANKLADRMVAACNNPCLGYDQGISRKGVLTYGIDTKIPTGCDCSSLVRACIKEAMGIDPGNFNTGNEATMLAKTGLFKTGFAYTNDVALHRGDILVTNTKGHTAIVVESNVETSTKSASTEKNQNDENSKWLWTYFKSCGLTDYATAGLLGNLYDESHLRPNNLQNSAEKKFNVNDNEYTQLIDNGLYSKEQFSNDNSGYGLAQWTSSNRKKGLYEFIKLTGKSIGDLHMQANYIWRELSTSKSTLMKLQSSNSIREASDVILHNYERPADQSEKVEKRRADYGKTFYDLYASKKTTKTVTPADSKEEFKVKVDSQFLNIRKGPGSEYDKTGAYTGVGVFTIVETKNGWGKLKSGAGWISLVYTKRI